MNSQMLYSGLPAVWWNQWNHGDVSWFPVLCYSRVWWVFLIHFTTFLHGTNTRLEVTRPTICLVALQDPTSFSPRDWLVVAIGGKCGIVPVRSDFLPPRGNLRMMIKSLILYAPYKLVVVVWIWSPPSSFSVLFIFIFFFSKPPFLVSYPSPLRPGVDFIFSKPT